ncbi:MAG: hypothetical protein IT410_04410 [Candidatus Doudnabacteria bacterium]|nr:hypothetical protein [Candidatus Doudnabacteria bacterium]
MTKLTQKQIDELYSQRLQSLDSLKAKISLKFYYIIAEKLQAEKKTLEALLNIAFTKKQDHDQYSFILDPQFFEQKFLKSYHGNSHSR